MTQELTEAEKVAKIARFGFDHPESGNMTGGTADCVRCESEEKAAIKAEGGSIFAQIYRDFIVCPKCGNKRCPRATYHGNPCSGSNEPGQKGSIYGSAAVQS